MADPRQHRDSRPSQCRRRPEKKGGQAAQALGRSRGGFSTKLHVLSDALGNPLRFVLTGGQAHDVNAALDLLDGWHPEFVIADRGYDAAVVREQIESQGAVPVIPPRQGKWATRWYDRTLYRERHVVEMLVNKLKHYRRVFARFDKLASRYLGLVHFVATLLWLR